MSSAALQLNEIAAQWRAARRVHAVYAPLVRTGRLGPASPELDAPVDRAEPAALERAHKWLEEMDARVEVVSLRQLLQTTQLGTEENLHALITRYLAREPKDDSLRDRLDFLLVQYFFQCAPPYLHQRDVSLEEVAEVLEPVLGECSTHPLEWLKPLDDALQALDRCQSMRDLLDQGILARGRQVKTSAGQMYFGSAALLAFVRFNFRVRRVFFRLMHADMHTIREGLLQLEARQVASVDCSRAQLSSQETLAGLRQICHDWKKPFRAAYSAGETFRQLVGIRAAVEAAVAALSAPAAEPAAPVEAAPAAVVEEAAAPAPPQPEPVAAAPGPAPVEVEAAPAPVAPPPEEKREEKVETPPAPVAPARPSATPPAPAAAMDVEGVLDRIAEQLLKSTERKGVSVTSIQAGNAKLLLSSWEVAAFVEGGDELSDALQRAVAARAVLVEVIDRCRRQPGGKPAAGSAEAAALPQAILAAEDEGLKIQAAVAEAKNAHNIDGAVNLAATAKRLQGSIDEAKKFLP